MITIISPDEIPQNSDEWLNLRSKFVTATNAYSLLKGKSIHEILDSKKNPQPSVWNYWADRGHRLEPDAKEIYSAIYQPTRDVGFVINDKFPFVGASPDGLVGEDGLVEVKSFAEKHHLAVMKKVDAQIVAQIQYQLWVTERKWNDFIAYNPDIEDIDKTFFVKRFYPDLEMHQKFETFFKTQLIT